MAWGINPNVSEKEKLKAKFNDYLQGMNSCGEIDYTAYSKLYDVCMPILEEYYDRMEKEQQNQKIGKWYIRKAKPSGILFPHCSCCEWYNTNWIHYPYCPHCGAKMEGE